MASTLACIGFDLPDGPELSALVGAALDRAETVGERGRTRLLRWQDPCGARLTMATDRAGELVGLVPSLTGSPGALLSDLTFRHDTLWSVVVVDESGEQQTGTVIDIEQSVLFDPRADLAGPASVIALGYDVEVFPDEDAFAAAPASLLDPAAEDRDRPPTLPPGMAWPLRVATVSFMSESVFAEPASAAADARLSGEVLAADTRRNTLTGLPFHVARVRTVGFEVDLCLPARDHPAPPPVGAIVSGWVYLVADVGDDMVRARARRGPRLPWRR